MGTRHRARQYAVQVLFQLDVINEPPGQVLPEFGADRKAPSEVVDFTEHLVLGVSKQRDRFDEVLESSAAHWKVARMAIVDRNVLRLALFEMLVDGSTPAPVIIDEAIELAKHFGNSESGPFVNGVLDGIRKQLEDGRLPSWGSAGRDDTPASGT